MAISIAQADRTPLTDPALAAAVGAIARQHGLGALPAARYASGSVPVVALGDVAALKLYPAADAEHAEIEARVLGALHGRLPLATPQPLGRGATEDGGTYLLMSQLPGRRLVEAWPELPADDRERIVEQVGHALAALHALDTAPLAELPGPRWPDFIARQRAEAVARHRERGLDAAWLDRIEPFLARWAPQAGGRTVLLHTEVMREHLLVERGAGGWRCSGLIDFEPAMLGARDYEFGSVGLFVTGGERRLLHRLLRAYGHPELDRDPSLPMRLLALALLHRYGHLRWYLQRLPVPGAATLEALAGQWFGVDAGV